MAVKTKNRIAETNGHAKGVIEVPNQSLRPSVFEVNIVGTAPLITDRPSEAAIEKIKNKGQGKAQPKAGPRDPHKEFLSSCYVMPGSLPAGEKGARYGIPASGFKHIMVAACRSIDWLTMAKAKTGIFQVLDDAGGMIQIEFDEMHMREDTARNQNAGGALIIIYRPEFIGWRCKLRIRHNAAVISAEQCVQLLAIGGFEIGWGCLRPEKGYSNGTFEVR